MSNTNIGTTTGAVTTSIVSFKRESGTYREVTIKLASAVPDIDSVIPEAYSLLPETPVDFRAKFGELLKLASVSGNQVKPDLYELDLTYMLPSSSWTTTGDTAKASSVTARELPLTEQQKGSLAAGVNTLTKIGVQVQYEETEKTGSFTWTEANIVDNCGKRDTPGSLGSPTANTWLKVEKSVSEAMDGNITVRDKWQYDENEWDSNIYD